jgi:hypothetical protein
MGLSVGSLEDVTTGRAGLVPSVLHERLGAELVQLGEPLPDVQDRLEQDAAPHATNVDVIARDLNCGSRTAWLRPLRKGLAMRVSDM